jgi:hypothetical protein
MSVVARMSYGGLSPYVALARFVLELSISQPDIEDASMSPDDPCIAQYLVLAASDLIRILDARVRRLSVLGGVLRLENSKVVPIGKLAHSQAGQLNDLIRTEGADDVRDSAHVISEPSLQFQRYHWRGKRTTYDLD